MKTFVNRWFGDPAVALNLIAAAACVGVSFQARGYAPFAWFGLIVIAFVARSCPFKLLPAYLAGVVLQLGGVDWMRQCFSNTEVINNWLLLGLAFGLILPLVLIFTKQLTERGWPLWLALPIAGTLGDYARYFGGFLLAGVRYPWLSLGYSQTDFPLVCQVADLGGVWLVGFLVVMIAATATQSGIERRLAIVPVVLICAAVLYSGWRMNTSFSSGPSVALMPNCSTNVPKVDLALWAETACEEPVPIKTSAVLVQGHPHRLPDVQFNRLTVLKDGKEIDYYNKVEPGAALGMAVQSGHRHS